jgi:hypothetical protein
MNILQTSKNRKLMKSGNLARGTPRGIPSKDLYLFASVRG